MESKKDAHWLIIFQSNFKADLHISSQKEAPTLMNKARFAGRTATRLRAIVRLQKSCILGLKNDGPFQGKNAWRTGNTHNQDTYRGTCGNGYL